MFHALFHVNHKVIFMFRYGADVEILENGEHYFHTEEQLLKIGFWADLNLT